MKFTFAFIGTVALILSFPCLGADAYSEWNQCLVKQQKTPQGKKAEKEGGIMGLNDFLINKCGFRPTRIATNGRSALDVKDCDLLFSFANEGSCTSDEMAGFQSERLRQLDPKVFQEKRYVATCEKLNNTSAKIDRVIFGRLVCGD